MLAGLYHFSVQDTQFLDHRKTLLHIRERAKVSLSPISYSLNDGSKRTYRLKRVDVSDPVFQVMARRRTVRGLLKKRPVSQTHLAECLYSGLGIMGFFEDRLLGRMPVKMTPSGGARNPYEAYVYALNVRGIDKGVYHYSALENTLQLVNDKKLPKPGVLLSGQNYANNAAAIIFLVANFYRTMWKYQHPTAYRVVLIEAGHIAQNIALTATRRKLTANPTAALQHSLIEKALELKPPLEAVIYGLTVGHPAPDFIPKYV